MKNAVFLIFLNLILFPTQAQVDPATGVPRKTVEEILQQRNPAQSRALLAGEPVNYLALDYPGGRKRFFPGDKIKFRLRSDRTRYHDVIYGVSDSTFQFLVENPVTQRGEVLTFRLSDVRRVYTTNRVPLLSEGMVVFPAAGLLYFIMDVFHPGNQLRRGEEFRVTRGTAIVTGGLFGLGYLGYRLTFRTHRTRPDGRHRLRVLRTY